MHVYESLENKAFALHGIIHACNVLTENYDAWCVFSHTQTISEWNPE
jgi:hypothetical protein